MRKYSKIFLTLSVVVLLAAGCSKAGNNSQQQNQPVQNQEQSAQPTTTQSNHGSINSAPAVTVTQTVQGSNFNKPSDTVLAGENAVDLLKRDHKAETREYSGLGEFVISIDGIKPDNKHFWAFYVNGKSSNVGAGSYKPKNGDKIEWKLEQIK